MKKYPATVVLISINLFVFAIQAFIQKTIFFDRVGDFYFILFAGANFNPFTMGGEYWRFYSSMFMHWDIVHLVVNMYGLYSIGSLLEPFLTTKRFVLLYILTGICAGVASLRFNVYIPSAGASGAIFGLFGYLITRQILENLDNRSELGKVLFNFFIFAGINYVIGKKMNLDTPAHLGGFFSGVVCAALHFFYILIPVWQLALAAAFSHLLIVLVPDYQLKYYDTFQNLLQAEDHLQSIYNQQLMERARTDSLRVIRSEWDTVAQQFKSFSNLPDALSADKGMLVAYVALRQQEINYRISGFEKESFVFLDSIEIVNARMDSLPPLHYPLNYRSRQPSQDSDTTATAGPDLPILKIFYDNAWRESDDATLASYYRVGKRDSLGRWQGNVTDYFLSGEIQMKGRYLNGMHDGVFRYYLKKGRYESLGRYDKDQAVGKWETYYPNRQLQSEVYYNDRSFTKTLYDSLGNPQVMNGSGKQTTWHANGKVREEGNYENGLKQGYWHGYHESGKPHYQELYRDGQLIQGVAITEKGERYVYDQLSVFPFPVIGRDAYKKYLSANLQRDPSMGDFHGTVKLSFLVDSDGTVRDFVMMNDDCIPCSLEAIRLVKEGPRWRPGVLRGHIKIRSNEVQEINF